MHGGKSWRRKRGRDRRCWIEQVRDVVEVWCAVYPAELCRLMYVLRGRMGGLKRYKGGNEVCLSCSIFTTRKIKQVGKFTY
jgi:hypothetical protein